jgi:hypothetical protein
LEACGLFSAGHWGLLLITVAFIVLGLYFARNMSEKKVRLTVRIVTAVLWALEVAKIIFVVVVNKETNPNHFIPLYYCSLILYAGLFSSLGRGWVQRIGDVFISTGGIIGGMCFMLLPTTSLPRYPMLHFISFHSFLLHGLMVFLGILMLMRGVCKLQAKDVYYCSGLISTMCVLATTFNIFWDANNPPDPENGIFGANLMFMSQDFPGTPVSLLYQWLDGPPLFSICMWLFQAFIPFFAVFAVYKLVVYMNEMTAARRPSVNELEEITVQINGVSPEQSTCEYKQEIE